MAKHIRYVQLKHSSRRVEEWLGSESTDMPRDLGERYVALAEIFGS